MILRPRWHRNQTLEDLEREVILAALYHNNESRWKTANELGISVRTLRNKLSRYRVQGVYKYYSKHDPRGKSVSVY